MDLIKKDDIAKLFTQHEGLCVSLFMPLEWEPERIEMNRIRLKNSIKQARNKLEDEAYLPTTMSEPDLTQFFEPAQELINDGRLEAQKSRGLAIFLGKDIEKIYRVPINLEEEVFIGQKFHIKPLLPILNNDDHFYLLALSQENAQLWRGSRLNLEKVDAPKLPAGIEEALVLEDPERSLQFHTSTGQGEARAAVHHGHEAEKEKKGAILRYFHMVNDALMIGLADEKAPLLVASVDYLFPIYQDANDYPHLVTENISGNPDHWNEQELYDRGWEKVESYFQQEREKVVNQYQEAAGSEKSSESIQEIVPAAAYGRVDTLIISKENGHPIWGKFDRDTGEVEMCQQSEFKCSDLIDFAVAETLQNGGSVLTVNPEEMPTETDIAAIFRYVVQ